MPIHDPRAKQAMYMSSKRKPLIFERAIFRMIIFILLPIVIALGLLWGFLF